MVIGTAKIRLLNILFLKGSWRFELVIIVLIIFIFLKINSVGCDSHWCFPLTVQQVFLLHLHSRRICYRFFQIFFSHMVRWYDIIRKLLLGICAGYWHRWEDAGSASLFRLNCCLYSRFLYWATHVIGPQMVYRFFIWLEYLRFLAMILFSACCNSSY